MFGPFFAASWKYQSGPGRVGTTSVVHMEVYEDIFWNRMDSVMETSRSAARSSLFYVSANITVYDSTVFFTRRICDACIAFRVLQFWKRERDIFVL